MIASNSRQLLVIYREAITKYMVFITKWIKLNSRTL